MKDAQNRGPLAGFSPLAGVSAGTAGVLFAFGVLLLSWRRVAAQVSLGIAVLVYVFIAALAVIFAAGAWLAFLFVLHRARNPQLLSRRQVAPPVAVAEAIETARPAAIEPPRAYLNLTDDQLAAVMRHHTEKE